MATTRKRKTKRRSAKRNTRKSSASARRARPGARGNGRANGGTMDAVQLLKNDHREVEKLFKQFERASSERQEEIARQICAALRAHTAIEEEIFYPAFLEATDEKDLHHEAEIEHEGAKHLIEEIESAGASDDYFEARVSVLKEMIAHHVEEEERRGGMLSKAAKADMDMDALGEEMNRRKSELMAEETGADADDGSERMAMPGNRRRAERETRARS
jgi:hemerythrin superfamily protein